MFIASLSASDVIKNSIVEGFDLARQNLTAMNIIITLAFSFLLGLFIFFVYKRTYRGVLYSHSYNLSLIMLCMVTSLIILVIANSLALSLGMVGALSIVRFRTAVKDPADTVYMFWAISVGITVGARYYLLAIIACAFIGLCVFALALLGNKLGDSYLLVIHCGSDGEHAVLPVLRKISRRKVKSKTVTRNGVEITYEVRIPNGHSTIVEDLLAVPGVYDATLVSYKGDMA